MHLLNTINTITANWDLFIGQQGKSIPQTGESLGGAISFRKHLDKPLSQELWEDLTKRFCAKSMSVIRYGQSEKTFGYGGKHVWVYLDESGNVDDIRINP